MVSPIPQNENAPVIIDLSSIPDEVAGICNSAIAKEGPKYAVDLFLLSQRPSDIEQTIRDNGRKHRLAIDYKLSPWSHLSHTSVTNTLT